MTDYVNKEHELIQSNPILSSAIRNEWIRIYGFEQEILDTSFLFTIIKVLTPFDD